MPTIEELARDPTFAPRIKSALAQGFTADEIEALINGQIEQDNKRDVGWLPTATRIGGTMLGGVVGAFTPLTPVGGAAVGAFLGDLIGQNAEINAGVRENYNPVRGAAETITGAIPGMGLTKGLGRAAIAGAAQGLGTTVLMDWAEGKPTSLSDAALGTAMGAGMGAVANRIIRSESLKELFGKHAPDIDEMLDGRTPAGATNATAAEDAAELARVARATAAIDPSRIEEPMWRQPANRGPFDLGFADPLREPRRVRGRFAGRQEPLFDFGLITNPSDDMIARANRPHLRYDIADDQFDEIAHTPSIEDKTERTFRNWIFENFTKPTKYQMEDLQTRTGYDTFDTFEKIKRGYERSRAYLNEQSPALRSKFKRINRDKRVALMEWMASDDETRKRIEATSRFTDHDRNTARWLYNYWDNILGEFGMTADDFFQRALPDIRSGAEVDMGKRLRRLGEYVANGEFDLGEPDALLATTKLLRTYAFRRFVADDWAEATIRYKDRSIPAEVRDPMMSFLNTVRGQGDVWAARLTNILNHALSQLDPAMDRLGKRHLRTTSEAFVSNMLALNYSSLMGFRPAPLIRNSFQGIQNAAPLMGGRWYVRGIKDAFTKEGRELVRQSGILGQGTELAELEESIRSPVGRAIQGLTRAGLKGFSTVEDLQRSVVYLGTRAKVLDAFKKSRGNLNEFFDRADLDMFLPQERKALMDSFSGGVEAIADTAARFMVENTQFMYSAIDRAPAYRGVMGRTLGGFSTWSTNYGQYLKRLATGFSQADTLGELGGNEVRRHLQVKAARNVARFVGYNGMLATAFAGMGHALKSEEPIQDVLGWVGFAPAIYTGGPVMQTAFSTLRAGREAASGNFELRNKSGDWSVGPTGPVGYEFRRNLKTFVPAPLPGSGITQDMYKAMQERTPMQRVGRLLGIKRGKVTK